MSGANNKTIDSLGFTLLELMIVILILGIFLSAFSLRIENIFTGSSLQKASRMIIGQIQSLRGEAAYTRLPQTLVLHLDQNAIYATSSSESRQAVNPGSMSNQQAIPASASLPRGVRLEDVIVFGRGKTQTGEVRIAFYANGTIERALIHLRNDAGDVMTLVINPLTGQVRLYDRYIDQKIGS